MQENSTIAEVINKFSSYKYLFIFDNYSLKGIITYADLNKAPIFAFCYIVISHFEALLREIVDKQFAGEREWLTKLSDNHQKDIGGVFIFEKAKGVERSLLECLTITHLKEISEKDGSWCISAGYASKEDFRNKMKKVIDWRNSIMHGRTIVLSDEGGKDLYSFIDVLGEQMEDLNNWLSSHC